MTFRLVRPPLHIPKPDNRVVATRWRRYVGCALLEMVVENYSFPRMALSSTVWMICAEAGRQILRNSKASG